MKFDRQLSVCYSYVMGCLLANISETVPMWVLLEAVSQGYSRTLNRGRGGGANSIAYLMNIFPNDQSHRQVVVQMSIHNKQC